MRAYVLGIGRYSFTPEGQTDAIKGISIVFLNDLVETTDNFRGKRVMKLTSDNIQIWNQFTTLPAFYELETTMSANSKMEVKVKLLSAKLLQEQKA